MKKSAQLILVLLASLTMHHSAFAMSFLSANLAAVRDIFIGTSNLHAANREIISALETAFPTQMDPNSKISEFYNDFSIKNSSYVPSERAISGTHFYISNDTGFKEQFQNLQFPKTPTGALKVALLVGESSFLSIASKLAKEVDLVLVVDIEHSFFTHFHHMLEVAKKAKGPEDFMITYRQRYQDTPIKDHKWEFGDLAFFASEERFREMQDAVNSLPVVTVMLNMMDPVHTAKLGNILKNASLKLLNLTNLRDYQKNRALLKSLPPLLAQLRGDLSRIPILHSTKGFFSGCMAKSDIGIHNYLKEDIEAELKQQKQNILAELLEKEKQREEKDKKRKSQELAVAILRSKTLFKDLEEDQQTQVLEYLVDSQMLVTITVQEWVFGAETSVIETLMNKTISHGDNPYLIFISEGKYGTYVRDIISISITKNNEAVSCQLQN